MIPSLKRKTQFQDDVFKPQKQEKSSESGEKNGNLTFWTVCPFCYCLFEYYRFYEGCSLRCQHCQRAFQGVAVASPPSEMVVEGKEQYYCVIGCFSLEYHLNGSLGHKKDKNLSNNKCFDGDCSGEKKVDGGGEKGNLIIDISDDSDDNDDDKSGEKGNGGFEGNTGDLEGVFDDGESGEEGEGEEAKKCDVALEEEVVKKGSDEQVKGNSGVCEGGNVVQGSGFFVVKDDEMKVKKRVKMVARNTKKLMGTGRNWWRLGESRRNVEVGKVDAKVELGKGLGGMELESGSGRGDGSSEGDLEFEFREDDIWVGFKNAT